jgi:hypothetical protein
MASMMVADASMLPLINPLLLSSSDQSSINQQDTHGSATQFSSRIKRHNHLHKENMSESSEALMPAHSSRRSNKPAPLKIQRRHKAVVESEPTYTNTFPKLAKKHGSGAPIKLAMNTIRKAGKDIVSTVRNVIFPGKINRMAGQNLSSSSVCELLIPSREPDAVSTTSSVSVCLYSAYDPSSDDCIDLSKVNSSTHVSYTVFNSPISSPLFDFPMPLPRPRHLHETEPDQAQLVIPQIFVTEYVEVTCEPEESSIIMRQADAVLLRRSGSMPTNYRRKRKIAQNDDDPFTFKQTSKTHSLSICFYESDKSAIQWMDKDAEGMVECSLASGFTIQHIPEYVAPCGRRRTHSLPNLFRSTPLLKIKCIQGDIVNMHQFTQEKCNLDVNVLSKASINHLPIASSSVKTSDSMQCTKDVLYV